MERTRRLLRSAMATQPGQREAIEMFAGESEELNDGTGEWFNVQVPFEVK